MLASEIFDEAKEVLANNDPVLVFRAMTRAVELLAPTKLFDLLVGDLDFTVGENYLVALPRDVKTPLRINIDNHPSFARSRLFEYAHNTDGSVQGAEVGWAWADRGTTPIHDEFALPGKLNVLASSELDNGKTVTVTGRDENGVTAIEVLSAHHSDPPEGEIFFHAIDSVVREATAMDVLLRVGTSPIARYYPDEREPRYKLIKLSQNNVSCRMHFRRHTYKIQTLDDIIPIDSPMGVLMMIDAVSLFWKKEYAAAAVAQEAAIKFVSDEHESRNEGIAMSASSEGQTASNRNISSLDEIIVADIYDEAASIFGPIGREKLFDRITDAVEALSRKGHWDSLLGTVDIWKPAHPLPNGDGYFVLPRFVETPLSINFDGSPSYARNGWFEFHLNGPGEQCRSSCGTWDDVGNTPIISGFPKSSVGVTIPLYLYALPDDAQDENVAITVHGYDLDGMPLKASVQCKSVATIDEEAKAFARIERIEKGVSKGFIRLFGSISILDPIGTLLGYYYPEETAPSYRMIKIATADAVRLRVKYRKRRTKVASMHEPLHLRSRLAIEAMMRAIQLEKTDVPAAALHEANALKYLKEEQAIGKAPTGFTMQFDSATMPGVTSWENFD